jgi:hypothetical protein
MDTFAAPSYKSEVVFPHGLGDCVYFTYMLALYRECGRRTKVKADLEKQFLFDMVGVDRSEAGQAKIEWVHGEDINRLDRTNHWRANKAFINISRPPLPSIGEPDAVLWDRFVNVRIQATEHLPDAVFQGVDEFLAGLKRPITLLHTKGNSFQAAKSVPDGLAVGICREIVEQSGGSVLLLDWDNRVPRIAHGRVKHLTDDWKRITAQELLALIVRADLVVGVDSGPLHLTRFTDTPAVGLWFNGHHPALYSLPRAQQVNITLKKAMHHANRIARWQYNIVEEQGEYIRPEIVGRTCVQMLGETRYCSPQNKGRDVMMRHWIDDWTRGGYTGQKTFADRNVSFDLILRHIKNIPRVRIVETGCIRCREDWRGAGYATYWLGAAAVDSGGHLDSVDNDPKHCAFAREECAAFGRSVTITCGDSVAFLTNREEQIDILYLDSWDADIPGYEEHGLREIQAAERLLHGKSMVIYDDTSIIKGQWIGKGKLGVPWLLTRGWHVLHAGHQTVLVREAPRE